MTDFLIEKSFDNGTIRFDNFNSSDNYHISFRVSLEAGLFSISYTFNEIVYWQLPFTKNENKVNIYDECCQKCRLIINDEYIELKIETDTISSVNRILLNYQDKDILQDFFIEFNALTYAVIYGEKQQ